MLTPERQGTGERGGTVHIGPWEVVKGGKDTKSGAGGVIRERNDGVEERKRGSSGWREVICLVCQRDRSAYRCTPAPRTPQMIVIRERAHLTTLFFSFPPPKEKTLIYSAAAFFFFFLNLQPLKIYLLDIFPGQRKRPPFDCLKKKKGKKSCIPPSEPPGFSQLPGGQQGSLGQSTMVWTLKLLLCSGAGGLAVQPYMATKRKALSVELNLHSKSPYSADYHTWERKNGEEKCSAPNFLTLERGEKISYLRLPPWCTYFFMYPYEHMIAMECKEVCILGEVRALVLENWCAALLQDTFMLCVRWWKEKQQTKVKVRQEKSELI